MYKDFKTRVQKANAQSKLTDLKSAAESYFKCVLPNDVNWKKEESGIASSLKAISIFRVAQALPLILSIMRKYDAQEISIKQCVNALSAIEKFTFQFNALTSSRGGGGIAAMYAKLAQKVHECSDTNEFGQLLKEIYGKFRERVPDSTEFSVAFTRLIYRNDYTRDRNLLRYVLGKLSKHAGAGTDINMDAMTIEHIKPQSTGLRNWEDTDVGSVGNLLFIKQELNGKIDDKKFKEKKKLLIQFGAHLDTFLEEQETWTNKDIALRGAHLAGIGHEKIWNI